MATETYKLSGSRNQGEDVGRVILEGSPSDPQRYVDVGGTIELSEDEVKSLRAKGLVLNKAADEEARGAEAGNPQVASGAQHGTAEEEQGDVNVRSTKR